MISNELRAYCQEIEEWPKTWEISRNDAHVATEILHKVFAPFFEDLIRQQLTDETIKKHINNIWLLGGEIIDNMNFDQSLRQLNSLELVQLHIDEAGGPYSIHLTSQEQINSFDSSCRKIYEYLKKHGRRQTH